MTAPIQAPVQPLEQPRGLGRVYRPDPLRCAPVNMSSRTKGDRRMVTNTMARRYSGALVGLRVRGLSEPLYSTPEHPYFVTELVSSRKVVANA